MNHKMPDGGGGNQPQNNQPDDMNDEAFDLNEEDVVETIELDEAQHGQDNIAGEMGDMDLEHYEEEQMEAGSGNDALLREDAAVKFTEHKGSVFCASFDSTTSSMVVTGGEDDKAFVWKRLSGEIVLECCGHKDSVTCAAFSHDSIFVATGDMAGLVKVWKMDSKEEIWSFEVSDLEWLQWHPLTHVLLAGTTDGDMWMWKIPSGDTKTFQSHGAGCGVARVMPDGKRACAGYDDGVVKVWDLKMSSPLHTISGHDGHQSTVTSMDCHPDNTVILTGSTDVTAKLLNSTSGKVLATFDCTAGSIDREDDSLEAVGFSSVLPLCAAGTLSGSLHIFDISSQVARHHCKHEAGIVRLKWAYDAPLVYTGTLDGILHLWDARTGKRENQWFGHTAEILDMDLARDGSAIATGSGDGTARIFSLLSPDR